MYVRYCGKSGTAAQYLCSGTFGSGGKYCISFGGKRADDLVSAEVLRELKKRILRTVLEEVVVDEPSPERLKLVLHWKGGVHTRLELARLSRGGAQRTAEEDLDIIRKMAVRYGDDDIARVLNKLGRRTGKGMAWSEVGVKTARRNHGIEDVLAQSTIPTYSPSTRPRGTST